MDDFDEIAFAVYVEGEVKKPLTLDQKLKARMNDEDVVMEGED